MLSGATGRGQNQTHCLRVRWLNKLNYTVFRSNRILLLLWRCCSSGVSTVGKGVRTGGGGGTSFISDLNLNI